MTTQPAHLYCWNVVRNTATGRVGVVVGVSEGYGHDEPCYDVQYGEHTYSVVPAQGDSQTRTVRYDDGDAVAFSGIRSTYEYLAATPQDYQEQADDFFPTWLVQMRSSLGSVWLVCRASNSIDDARYDTADQAAARYAELAETYPHATYRVVPDLPTWVYLVSVQLVMRGLDPVDYDDTDEPLEDNYIHFADDIPGFLTLITGS